MKLVLTAVFAICLSVSAFAQGIIHGSGAPTSLSPKPNCNPSRFYVDDSTQKLWVSNEGSPCTWVLASSAGGSSSAGSATAGQASDGSGGFVDDGCTTVAGVKTCGAFVTTGPGGGVGQYFNQAEGTIPTTDAAGITFGGTGFQGCYADSTAHTLKCKLNGGSVVTIAMPAGTLAIASGKTATVSNTITLTGTDSASYPLNAFPLTDLATQATDTVVQNATAATAVPTAVAIPACANDGSHALVYTSHAWACASISGGGSVAGSDTDVQINKSAAFGVDAGVYRYDYTLHQLYVGANNAAIAGSFKSSKTVADSINHRWFEELSSWTAGADSLGSGTFADFITYAGSHNYDHHAVVEGSPNYNGSGALGVHFGLEDGLTVNGMAITSRYAVYVANPTVNSGSIATNVGIHIDNQTAGSSNYSMDDRCTNCVGWHAGKIAFGAFASPTNTLAVAAGNLGFEGGKGQHIVTQAANNDIAGTLATSSSTTASVTFTTNYAATPACVLTPRTAGLTSWYLSSVAVSGFTVTVAPSGTYTFAYVCIGNPS